MRSGMAFAMSRHSSASNRKSAVAFQEMGMIWISRCLASLLNASALAYRILAFESCSNLISLGMSFPISLRRSTLDHGQLRQKGDHGDLTLFSKLAQGVCSSLSDRYKLVLHQLHELWDCLPDFTKQVSCKGNQHCLPKNLGNLTLFCEFAQYLCTSTAN